MVNNALNTAYTDGTAAADITEADDFLDACHTLKSRAGIYCKNLIQLAPEPAVAPVITPSANLPKIQIEHFYGATTKFDQFWSLFETRIDQKPSL